MIRPVRETKTQVTLRRDDYDLLLASQTELQDYVTATQEMRSLQLDIVNATITRDPGLTWKQGYLQGMRDWSNVLLRVMARRNV